MTNPQLALPRVLRIDLDGARDLVGRGPIQLAGESWTLPSWKDSPPSSGGHKALELGGAALAQALMLALDPLADPFILSVGAAVVRGLPTAARTNLSARSPLTGGLAEGQVGSELGRRLAFYWDAVVLLGKVEGGSGVLILDGQGAVSVCSRPDLLALSGGERNAQLVRDLGPGVGLCSGPAAQAGVRYAQLAAGSDPPSFVGGAGLGRALAQHGLLGLFVQSPPVPSRLLPALGQALLESPRLKARSLGGTLELFDVQGVDSGAGAPDLGNQDLKRHGCRGCPTPCGVSLKDSQRPAGGSLRFSALGPLLGAIRGSGSEHQSSGEDSGGDRTVGVEQVLEVCNALGLDAREAARDLAAEAPFKDLAAVTLALEQLVLEGAGPVRPQVLVAGAGHAARVGPLTCARGSDPMRSLPFLSPPHGDPARLVRSAPDIDWTPEILDPQQSQGSGYLAAWHEDLVAALDALGFCTFSAAGLLADGVLDLDELAQVLVPSLEGHGQAGVALREAGAEVALGAHQLLAHWGAPATAVDAGQDAAMVNSLGEYRRWRGLDERGRPTRDPQPPLRTSPPLPSIQPERISQEPGWVELRATGLLAEQIGGACRVQLDLPALPSQVLEALARVQPGAARMLTDKAGISLPSIWRGGEVLDARALVVAGDQLDLVLVVPGG